MTTFFSSSHTLAKHLTRKLEGHCSVFGKQLRMARLRRKLSMKVVAERSNCSVVTLAKVEKGDPTVAFGIYARVLFALQLEDDILLLAKDDKLGRMLQDMEIKPRRRAPKTGQP